MIAALYVLTGGCYFGLPDVDPWDEKRDARKYDGPHKVLAHPPCERWGRYWFGGPSARVKRVKGDDGGCFASALAFVRKWGGVLEHPVDSSAWAHFGLMAPPRNGGWVRDVLVPTEWTCCVEQGHYGHPARKPTWLFVSSTIPPAELKWGPAPTPERKPIIARERTRGVVELLSRRQRQSTPPEFRDVLLRLAADCVVSR